MSAFVRIYTCLGKENICYVETFTLGHEVFDNHSRHTLTFHDKDEETLTDIKRIIQDGQPCNIHIRFEDSDVEAECILDCCTVCEETNRILCPNPKITTIRYKTQ